MACLISFQGVSISLRSHKEEGTLQLVRNVKSPGNLGFLGAQELPLNCSPGTRSWGGEGRGGQGGMEKDRNVKRERIQSVALVNKYCCTSILYVMSTDFS